MTSRSRLRRFAVSGIALTSIGLTGCAGSGHATGTTQATAAVRGPATVVPGAVVRFQASGFRPGSNLVVVIAPADKGPCCGIRIPATFAVPSAGSTRIAFRMPAYYRRCSASGTGSCSRVRWTRSERASVTVSGYLEQAVARITVGAPNL